jgi:RNA-binding protein
MDIKKIKELRAQSHSLEPILQIGKEKITENIVKEILRQLKKKKLIKIKLLKSAGDRKELTKKITALTGAALIRSVGRVIVLYKSSR